MAEESGAGRLGVEVVGCGPAGTGSLSRCHKYLFLEPELGACHGISRDLLIQIEAPGGRGDADLPVLGGDHKQVHKVSVHLAVPRRGVPATHGEHFQTLQGLQKWPSMETGVWAPPPPTRVTSLMLL